MTKHKCENHGDNVPGCLGEADERYTMDYTDVRPGAYLYWCSSCGPAMHSLEKSLMHALKTRPGLAKELTSAIEEAEYSQGVECNDRYNWKNNQD